MNTTTISLHRQNALIKFRELKNLVSIMKRTITLLCKVLIIVNLNAIKFQSGTHRGILVAAVEGGRRRR
jgi:hypothetical protein